MIELPNAEYYLEKSIEFSRTNNFNKAIAHFNTFLRFHNFKDDEIYKPDSVKLTRYAKLLSKLPKILTGKYNLTSDKLKKIHSGKSINETVVVATQMENHQTPSVPQTSPVFQKKEPAKFKTNHTPPIQEKISPPPIETSRTAEKVAVAENIRKSPKLRRLIKKYTKDKEFILKQSDGLTLEGIIESFNLQARQENVKKISDGFKISLPYSAQHLGGTVGKKKQPKYIVSNNGETIQEILTKVEQLVPALCTKRSYRCSSFSKKVVSGRVADSLPKAAKNIYLWNHTALKNHSFEELLKEDFKIKGGTELDIFTDFIF